MEDGNALPSWLSFDKATRNFNGIPSNDDVGSINIKVIATDGSSESIFDVFMVTVNNVNNPPTVANELSDQTVNEDSALTIHLVKILSLMQIQTIRCLTVLNKKTKMSCQSG